MSGEKEKQTDRVNMINEQVRKQERVKPWPEPTTESSETGSDSQSQESGTQNSQQQESSE